MKIDFNEIKCPICNITVTIPMVFWFREIERLKDIVITCGNCGNKDNLASFMNLTSSFKSIWD